MALVVGILAGLHTATWGMYKDAIHEAFTVPRYLRSVIVSALSAPIIVMVAGLDPFTASGLVTLFGVTYCMERALTEFWKTFVRFIDQSKFTIPMQFHVFGRVIPQGPVRWTIAAGHLAVAALLLVWIHSLQNHAFSWPRPVVILLMGSIGGWYSACGGGFKDAPIEGFSALKFVRSPILSALYALLLSNFTDDYVLMALGGLGYTVATIETYKTFFFPSRPRGKFAGKPILYPRFLAIRQRFVPLYAGIWVLVMATLWLALREPRTESSSESGRNVPAASGRATASATPSAGSRPAPRPAARWRAADPRGRDARTSADPRRSLRSGAAVQDGSDPARSAH
jgi:hypothetical protein